MGWQIDLSVKMLECYLQKHAKREINLDAQQYLLQQLYHGFSRVFFECQSFINIDINTYLAALTIFEKRIDQIFNQSDLQHLLEDEIKKQQFVVMIMDLYLISIILGVKISSDENIRVSDFTDAYCSIHYIPNVEMHRLLNSISERDAAYKDLNIANSLSPSIFNTLHKLSCQKRYQDKLKKIHNAIKPIKPLLDLEVDLLKKFQYKIMPPTLGKIFTLFDNYGTEDNRKQANRELEMSESKIRV